MLDKVVLSTDRHSAIIYFTNREPFRVYSDKDVTLLVLDLISPIGTRLASTNFETVTDYILSQGGTVILPKTG